MIAFSDDVEHFVCVGGISGTQGVIYQVTKCVF
jgi:hypothetical protein